MRFSYFLSVFVAALLFFSCTSADTKTEKSAEHQSGVAHQDSFPTARGGELTFDPKEYVKKQYDSSRDGKPDVINIFKKVPKEGVRGEYDLHIHVKMMDLNRDGKIDVWRFYDERGAIAKEELDLDFDGKIDVVNYYVNGVIRRKEFDTRFNEKTDKWKHYDENGVLLLIEEDQSNNGNVDYWEHYTKGVLERIEKDTTNDGKPDIFQRSGDSGFTRIMSTTDKFDETAELEKEFSRKVTEVEKKEEEAEKIVEPEATKEDSADSEAEDIEDETSEEYEY